MEKIKERSMVKFVLLTLITGNLYNLYFYYRLSLDVNTVCEGDGQESDNYLTAVILGLLTFGIYRYYWLYKMVKRLRANSPRYGFKIVETGKDMLLLDICSLGYISSYELIKNMNRIAATYNQTGLADVEIGGIQ